MAIPPKVYQFLVGVFASLGSFLFGYDLTIIASIISSESFLIKFAPSAAEVGLVVSIFTGGAFVGAGIGGPAGDYIGRRWTILLGAAIFCVGGGLQAGAQNLSYLYGGRFLAGVGVGVLVMIVPLYQAELAHPDIRGLVTGLQQFMLGIGGVCGSWISYGTHVALTNDGQWTIPFGLQIVPAAVLGLLIFLFPESPRWLISHGRADEGLQTIARLHARGDQTDAWVVAEFHQIQEQVSFEQEHELLSYKELFTEMPNLRRIFLACAVQAATQMTGVSAIQYYSVLIFSQIGIDATEALRYQAVGTILGLLGEFLLMVLVDRLGRRWTLIGGNLAMCGTFVISTALLAQFPPTSNNNGAHWAFIVMTWFWTFFFGSTSGPLSWIIPAEIFDNKTRSKGVGIAAMVSFAFNTLIGQVTPIGMEAVGWRFYLLFCVTNFTNALFFWAFLPETKKLPLEEMQRLFTEAPLFVPSMSKDFHQRRIDQQVLHISEKSNPEGLAVETERA